MKSLYFKRNHREDHEAEGVVGTGWGRGTVDDRVSHTETQKRWAEITRGGKDWTPCIVHKAARELTRPGEDKNQKTGFSRKWKSYQL